LIVGYTTGVFDLFHIGHLNLLKNAKGLCDRLIVGVSTDELVAYKHKSPVIPFQERLEIVRACRFVDAVIPQDSLDKVMAWEKIGFDVLIVGDDWHKEAQWRDWEQQLAKFNVKVRYFPYTTSTSSTLINQTLIQLREGGTA
jgi:glycerol-3-phosphate cytidylyltransferase